MEKVFGASLNEQEHATTGDAALWRHRSKPGVAVNTTVIVVWITGNAGHPIPPISDVPPVVVAGHQDAAVLHQFPEQSCVTHIGTEGWPRLSCS